MSEQSRPTHTSPSQSVPIHSKPRELIILGCGPTHVECPYDQETWGVNGTYTFAKRLDKLFMTDGPDVMDEDILRAKDIASYGCTLILAKKFPEVMPAYTKAGVKVEVYPIDEVLEKFPTRFFSNTIAYMIAYALLSTKTVWEDGLRPKVVEGYSKIRFYGIDMMTNTTYLQEKGGVEYWMGVALGMGVDIVNTRGSATGKTWNGKMYGYWGQMQEEMMKERLMVPWEIVKATAPRAEAVPPIAPIDEEWIQSGDDWIKVPCPPGY